MIQVGRSCYCALADATVTLVQSPWGSSLDFGLFSGASGERLTLHEASFRTLTNQACAGPISLFKRTATGSAWPCGSHSARS